MPVVAAIAMALPGSAAAARDGGFESVGPTSSSELLFGVDRNPSVELLRIKRTQTASPEVLYSIRLDEVHAPSAIDVRSTTQLVRCRSDDIRGANKPDHACAGTEPYSYDPKFFWRIVLSDSPTDAGGRTVVQDWRRVRCREVVHHCAVPAKVNGFQVGGAGAYVNFVAAAQADSARKGQVMPVSHGSMQVIQTLSPFPIAAQTEISGPVRSSFPMSPGGSRADRDDLRPAVLFSQPVDVEAGDVVDAEARLELKVVNSKDNAPLIATYLFLTSDPEDLDYTPPDQSLSFFRRAAENCPKTCSATRLGAVRSPVAGRMYVNLVALGKDHEYKTKATVVYDGSLAVTKR
jgi:hypothetical protein